ncbi:MAG: hypothetical protein LQ351_002325 [Letrouitia transgressa]|nr:MAG: hypothetical protein LQ351_002325 [Letrouitia transgressa]
MLEGWKREEMVLGEDGGEEEEEEEEETLAEMILHPRTAVMLPQGQSQGPEHLTVEINKLGDLVSGPEQQLVPRELIWQEIEGKLNETKVIHYGAIGYPTTEREVPTDGLDPPTPLAFLQVDMKAQGLARQAGDDCNAGVKDEWEDLYERDISGLERYSNSEKEPSG